MTARDCVESVAGLFLLLFKIMWCLMFAGYARIALKPGGGYRQAPEPRPQVQALGRG